MPLRADIGTKTADHHAHMLMAIAAGKHVLCEKPFTDTAEQAREVYAAAEAKGLFCQEGMWVRYFPAYEHAKAAIELGVIGDIKGVSADYPDRVCPSSPPSPLAPPVHKTAGTCSRPVCCDLQTRSARSPLRSAPRPASAPPTPPSPPPASKAAPSLRSSTTPVR